MGVDFIEIKEAVQKRDDFLRDHPELIPLQDEINHALKEAGRDKRKRNTILQLMLLESWSRITRI
jgi:hypothetical protein